MTKIKTYSFFPHSSLSVFKLSNSFFIVKLLFWVLKELAKLRICTLWNRRASWRWGHRLRALIIRRSFVILLIISRSLRRGRLRSQLMHLVVLYRPRRRWWPRWSLFLFLMILRLMLSSLFSLTVPSIPATPSLPLSDLWRVVVGLLWSLAIFSTAFIRHHLWLS